MCLVSLPPFLLNTWLLVKNKSVAKLLCQVFGAKLRTTGAYCFLWWIPPSAASGFGGPITLDPSRKGEENTNFGICEKNVYASSCVGGTNCVRVRMWACDTVRPFKWMLQYVSEPPRPCAVCAVLRIIAVVKMPQCRAFRGHLPLHLCCHDIYCPSSTSVIISALLHPSVHLKKCVFSGGSEKLPSLKRISSSVGF